MYNYKKHLSLTIAFAMLLLSTFNAVASTHLQIGLGAHHLTGSASPLAYQAALSLGYHQKSGCQSEIGLLAQQDNLSMQIVAYAAYPLLQLNNLTLSARLQGSIGAGFSNDIWYYRSLAVGAQANLLSNNHLVTAWVVQGKKEASAWRFNQLKVPFRVYGISLTPMSQGLGITVTANDSPAPPELGTISRIWAVTAEYRLTL